MDVGKNSLSRNIFSDLLCSVSTNSENHNVKVEDDDFSRSFNCSSWNLPPPIIVDLTSDDECDQTDKVYSSTSQQNVNRSEISLSNANDDIQNCDDQLYKVNPVDVLCAQDINNVEHSDSTVISNKDHVQSAPLYLNKHANVFDSKFLSPPHLVREKYSPLDSIAHSKLPKSLEPSDLPLCSSVFTNNTQTEILSRLDKFAPIGGSPCSEFSVNFDEETEIVQLSSSSEHQPMRGYIDVNTTSFCDIFNKLENIGTLHESQNNLINQHDSLNHSSSANVNFNFHNNKCINLRLPKKLAHSLQPPTLPSENEYLDTPSEKYPSRITLEPPGSKFIGKVCTKASVRREIVFMPTSSIKQACVVPPLYTVKASTILENDSFQEAELRQLKIVVPKLSISKEELMQSSLNSSGNSSSDSLTTNSKANTITNALLVSPKSHTSDAVVKKSGFARKRTSKLKRSKPRLIREIENTMGFLGDDPQLSQSRESKALNIAIDRISINSKALDSPNDTASTCSTIELTLSNNTIKTTPDAQKIEESDKIQKKKKKQRRRQFKNNPVVGESAPNPESASNDMRHRKRRKRLLSETVDADHDTTILSVDIPQKICRKRRRKLKCATSSAAQQIKQKYAQARRQFVGPTGLHPKVLKCLEMKKEDPSLTPMHLAASLGHQVSLEHCLSQMPHMIHDRDSFGRTPLHWSSFHNHVGITKLLLEVGADPNAASLEEGRRPLHETLMRGGSLAMVKLLVEAGADPDFSLYSGKSMTSLTKDPEILKYLESITAIIPFGTRDYEFDLRQFPLPTVFTLRSSNACGQCKNYVLAKDIAMALNLSYPTFVNRYSARITLISSNFTDLRKRFVSDVDTRCDGLGKSFEVIVGHDCDFLLVEYDDRVRDLLHTNRFSVTKEEAEYESSLLCKLDLPSIDCVSSPEPSVSVSSMDTIDSCIVDSPLLDRLSPNSCELSNAVFCSSSQRRKQLTPLKFIRSIDSEPLQKQANARKSQDLMTYRKKSHSLVGESMENTDDISHVDTDEEVGGQNTSAIVYRQYSDSILKNVTTFYAPVPTLDHTYALNYSCSTPLKLLERLEQGCKHILLNIIQWRNDVFVTIGHIRSGLTVLPVDFVNICPRLVRLLRNITLLRSATYKRHHERLSIIYYLEMQSLTKNNHVLSAWKEFVEFVLTDHMAIVNGYMQAAMNVTGLFGYNVNLISTPIEMSLRRDMSILYKQLRDETAIVTECETMFLQEIKRLRPLLTDVDWDNEDSSPSPSPLPSISSSSTINHRKSVLNIAPMENASPTPKEYDIVDLDDSFSPPKKDIVQSVTLKKHPALFVDETNNGMDMPDSSSLPNMCGMENGFSRESIVEKTIINLNDSFEKDKSFSSSIPVYKPLSKNIPHSDDCTSCDFCKRLKKLETNCQAVLLSNVNAQKRRSTDVPTIVVPSDFSTSIHHHGEYVSHKDISRASNIRVPNFRSHQDNNSKYKHLDGDFLPSNATIDLTSDSE